MTGGYGESGQRYLTVAEAAELLSVAVNTVYRWCRAGRLRARKFGQEWRISASALEELGYREATSPTNPLEPVIRELRRGGERLLGLAADRVAEERLETLFLDLALREPGCTPYLVLWDESPEEANDRLRATLAPHGTHKGSLGFLHSGDRYRASGIDGILEESRSVARSAMESGERLWVAESPQRFFGANVGRLVEYSNAVTDLIAYELDSSKLGVAITTFDSSYAGSSLFEVTAQLLESHSAVVWFDGFRAPHLLRPVI